MGRIRSNYVLQVHRVTSGEVVRNFINDIWFLCHVATWTSHVATSKLHALATSRRGPPTSLRHFLTLSATSRRGLTRRDVKSTCLYHVATWNSHVAMSLLHFSVTSRRRFTRRDVDWYKSLSCRDVAPNVATLACLLFVTSRRHPARCDVALF